MKSPSPSICWMNNRESSLRSKSTTETQLVADRAVMEEVAENEGQHKRHRQRPKHGPPVLADASQVAPSDAEQAHGFPPAANRRRNRRHAATDPTRPIAQRNSTGLTRFTARLGIGDGLQARRWPNGWARTGQSPAAAAGKCSNGKEAAAQQPADHDDSRRRGVRLLLRLGQGIDDGQQSGHREGTGQDDGNQEAGIAPPRRRPSAALARSSNTWITPQSRKQRIIFDSRNWSRLTGVGQQAVQGVRVPFV